VARPPEAIEFRFDDWLAVTGRMDALAAAGHGWVNLFPEVSEDDLDADADPPSSGLAGLLRGGGPRVPMGTWVAATGRRRASVGLQHGLREKVKARLQDHGIAPPVGWSVVQDHPRRGVVVELPATTAPEEALAWLMEAVDDLCPFQLTGQWLAEVHDR